MSGPPPPPLHLDLDPTYGAMFIGVLFATFFQGVLTLQTYTYFESFPEDSWRIKLTVAGVWCLDTTHLILISQSAYHYLVTNWGNPPALLISTVPLDLNLAFIGMSSILCQAFFLNRVWIFSHKNIFLVAFLAAICLTTFALDLTITVKIILVPVVTQFGVWRDEAIAVFGLGAIVDIAIALLLCYYVRSRRTGFEKTNSLISRVVYYTVATGLATSLVALACLIAYLTDPNSFIFIAMHFSLGRMYTNALLATLNQRQALRLQNASGYTKTSSFRHDGSNPPAASITLKGSTHEQHNLNNLELLPISETASISRKPDYGLAA